jgi:hypothetical protein
MSFPPSAATSPLDVADRVLIACGCPVLSGIVFVIEGVTKFTAGSWVAIVLIGAITVTALRTRRYYVRTAQQLAHR